MSDSFIWTMLGHLVCIAQWAAFILVDYADSAGAGGSVTPVCGCAAGAWPGLRLWCCAVLAFSISNQWSVISSTCWSSRCCSAARQVDRMSAASSTAFCACLPKIRSACLCTAPRHLAPVSPALQDLSGGTGDLNFAGGHSGSTLSVPVEPLQCAGPAAGIADELFPGRRGAAEHLHHDLLQPPRAHSAGPDADVGLTIAVLAPGHRADVQRSGGAGAGVALQAALEQQRAEALMEFYTAQRRLDP